MLELRQYQNDTLDALRAGFINGSRAQILYAPTGAGKTEMAIALLEATRKKGRRAAMILDRIVLCNQTSQRLEKYKIDHGVLQSGHWRYRPWENIQVCSAQTLERRGSMPDLDLLIVDECFTGNTLISTPSGAKKISLLRCGDTVYNSIGVGTVLRVMVKPTQELYEVKFEDGTSIECTGNHPIFTDRGWVKTAELEVGRVSFSKKGMCVLWQSIQPQASDREWPHGDAHEQREMGEAYRLLNILLQEVGKSDEQSSVSVKDASKTARDQAQANQAGWQWTVAAAAATCFASCTGGGLGVGIFSGYKDAEFRAWLSYALQNRHSESGEVDCDRARRWFARFSSAQRTRLEKDRISCFPRVVGVSRVKCDRIEPVFNLHISGHPSYFAHGKLVHNCHATREQTMEFVKNNPGVKVIGLTATPFTKGLGRTYENVVSTVTTKQLVDSKILVPLRVFLAKEIDMEGAKKVAGEWSQEETTQRAVKITGDIVAEWVKKTHEIFGKPAKTIVFCAGVAHGAELAQKFAEQGYNFVSISYRDDDEFKRDAIEDFSKPDTKIHGLIATDILTKGFDVPDVMIGVSARPFSKSLSSHIQQMGRVMRGAPGKEFAVWLCLAKGSRVLTDKGLVPIDKVTLNHKIWDGTNFVSHGGAVCNGVQKVITYQGLTATPGHLVHTAEGWRTFGYCASKQIRITQTGFGRHAIRIGEDLRSSSFLVGIKTSKIYSCFVRMRDLWLQKFDQFKQFEVWQNKGLSSLQPAGCSVSDVAVQQSTGHESKMRQQKSCYVSRIRRAWGEIQVFWRQRSHDLDHGKFGFAGVQNNSSAFSYSVGQDRSGRSLRTWEFAMALCRAKSAKQKRESISSAYAQVQDGAPRDSLRGQYSKKNVLVGHDCGPDHRKVLPTIYETEREVWDILDAGPNNRFTCEGLLVHNCHSGNYLRFRPDWEEVYENGVTELDDGKEKAKKEPSEREKKESKCPVCEALWPTGSDTCLNCGHVRERKSAVVSVPGQMEELQANRLGGDSPVAFWGMCVYKMNQNGWSKGRAAHTFREKFGYWPNGFINKECLPDKNFEKFVRAKLIRYLKGKR